MTLGALLLIQRIGIIPCLVHRLSLQCILTSYTAACRLFIHLNSWCFPLRYRPTELARPTLAGQHRLKHALRPATWANHRSHFKAFLVFCYQHGQNPARCSMDTVLAFTQSLMERKFSASNINYLSSLKTMFTWLRINTPLLAMEEWSWNVLSIARVIRDPLILRSSITLDHLTLLCLLCYGKRHLAPLRVFLTFAFFGLFRISNVAPVIKKAFDKSRNTLVCDVRPQKHGLHVIIKWTKTRQTKALALVPLPAFKDEYICPTQAWQDYTALFDKYTAQRNNPLLADPNQPASFLSATQIRRQLKELCALANLQKYQYTPHSFRRGGAALLFKAGVDLQDIKHHGLWVSSAVEPSAGVQGRVLLCQAH